MGAIGWFTRHPVAANLLMVVIMAGGLIAVVGIPLPFLPENMRRPAVQQEVFPEISLDLITVTVPYLGAAPEEVEEATCVRVEEAIQGLDGVKRITSMANEGFCVVTVELLLGSDSRVVLDDVKARVDAIDTFPAETEKPIIREITNRRQVIDVAISGDADEWSLRHVAEQVRDEISALPGITLVELANSRPFEVSVEVSEAALRRHGLTFDQVANAVRFSSLDLPGGSLRTDGGEILLRTKGQAYTQREFEELVLLSRPDGTHLLLGDVAHVIDGFAETDQFTRFDAEPAMLVQVFRVGKQDALRIADQVKSYLAEAQPRMPEGISLNIWQDMSRVLRDRRNLLMRNAATGFALVILILALFLNLRLAAWVSLGIPISFLGAMWVMPGLDLSVNMISMFAFIVVLGIVVDDAIIAGENIHRHQQRHRQGLKGAIDGAREVAVPVTFAVLTSVAAFLPLLTVAGLMGKIMRVIPLIVIPCLLWSLVESLLILPAHLSHLRPRPPEPAHRSISSAWRKFQGRFADGLESFIDRFYTPVLDLALRWRYLTAAIGIATLLLTMGLVRGGFVRFFFFPDVESDFVSAALTMPPGTPVEVTSDAVLHLERTAEQVRREVEQSHGEDVFKHMLSAIGEQPFGRAQQQNAGGAQAQEISSHLGELTIELLPAEDRTVSSTTIAEAWRKAAGRIPAAVELRFTASLFQAGDDIDVQLTGSDIPELRSAADELKLALAEYSGVYDIADSFRAGKREVKLNITPAAEVLGLTLANLARQVRQAFYGEEAQRIQRGRDDVKVMVRYPEAERRSLGDMENMRIRTPDGAEVPFAEVADVELGRGYAAIKRVDRRRAINVTADVDPAQATPGEIIEDLKARVLPELVSLHPGLTYSFEGQQAEQRDTMGGLVRGFAIALLMIYALLAIPLRSYAQPVVIMSAIPFGLVGAVWGHVIMRLDLTIMSMFGLVALTGVVVNDSLVMVDFVNRHRRSKGELFQAIRQAGAVRFRPILLTSLTTFAGLSPLMLERSMQARFLIPMAVSLAFGVVFSTFITLILIPSGYMIMEDLRRLVSRRGAETDQPVASRAEDQSGAEPGPLPDGLERPTPLGTGARLERLSD
jgi:multidrug efflux pump subunit AcrB